MLFALLRISLIMFYWCLKKLKAKTLRTAKKHVHSELFKWSQIWGYSGEKKNQSLLKIRTESGFSMKASSRESFLWNVFTIEEEESGLIIRRHCQESHRFHNIAALDASQD